MIDRTVILTPGPRQPRYRVIAGDAEATGRIVHLDWGSREADERAFVRFFGQCFSETGEHGSA